MEDKKKPTYIHISKEDRLRIKVLSIKNGVTIPNMLTIILDSYEKKVSK